MAAMEGFKRLFGAQNSTIRLIRNYGLSAINGLGAIKKVLPCLYTDLPSSCNNEFIK
jgi:hypothetical protein